MLVPNFLGGKLGGSLFKRLPAKFEKKSFKISEVPLDSNYISSSFLRHILALDPFILERPSDFSIFQCSLGFPMFSSSLFFINCFFLFFNRHCT